MPDLTPLSAAELAEAKAAYPTVADAIEAIEDSGTMFGPFRLKVAMGLSPADMVSGLDVSFKATKSKYREIPQQYITAHAQMNRPEFLAYLCWRMGCV